MVTVWITSAILTVHKLNNLPERPLPNKKTASLPEKHTKKTWQNKEIFFQNITGGGLRVLKWLTMICEFTIQKRSSTKKNNWNARF